jgi:hypothetical protein
VCRRPYSLLGRSWLRGEVSGEETEVRGNWGVKRQRGSAKTMPSIAARQGQTPVRAGYNSQSELIDRVGCFTSPRRAVFWRGRVQQGSIYLGMSPTVIEYMRLEKRNRAMNQGMRLNICFIKRYSHNDTGKAGLLCSCSGPVTIGLP